MREPGDEPELTYLDHAATTPLRPGVADAMAPFCATAFGNPSGSHRVARQARAAIEDARDSVAEILGADPGEIVFTGSGTEADNLAVLGALGAATDWADSPVVVCSAVEHAAVRATCHAAAGPGRGSLAGDVREAPVDGWGRVAPDGLEELLDPSVAVVSVMLANNEVGTIQPLADVAKVVRRCAPAAVVHTDAVQAAVFLDLAEAAADADLVSLSGHKLGGPKGVGALVVRRHVRLVPIIHGGGQERERRSGTHNVAGIVGFAAALQAVGAARTEESSRVAALRDRLAEGLRAAVPGARYSAGDASVLPGHCHLRFEGVAQEELVLLLDDAGVCVSAGAACASGAVEESHVLAAMGVPPAEARTSIRFSLGHSTTAADVERALVVVPEAVARLRAG